MTGNGLSARLERHVRVLAEEIGERNLRDETRQRALGKARDYLYEALSRTGKQPAVQEFSAGGHVATNLEIEVEGHAASAGCIVIGAHYDTAHTSPGANDNATGVAVLLQLAEWFSSLGSSGEPPPSATLRFVLFSCEEPPFTRTPSMGSLVYAKRCQARGEQIGAMLSLETLGSFYEEHRGPEAPFPLNVFSPFRGDFVAVVGNLRSRSLAAQVERGFRTDSMTRCLAFGAPGVLPGIKSSDHWSFWKYGYRAVMVTDTAPLRYRHYHRPTDRVQYVDFVRLADIARGLRSAVASLA
jgi:Zn-dependent M28 family amino/carboxypeptidase